MLIGVTTTGIVCRPGCSARPHARNTVVLPDLAAARRRGLRPCRRCRPERESAAPGATIRLGTRRPFAAGALAEFIAARAIPGVDRVEPAPGDGAAGRAAAAGEVARYERRLRLAHGVASLRLTLRADGVDVVLDADPRDAADALARVSSLLDLDADAPAIDAALATDPVLAPLVAATPGLRAPGHLDPAELLARAIVGQQISVAATRTILGRLAAGGLFPSAGELAGTDPAALPMPRSRARALTGAMAALADDPELLADRERLLALPGVGPWTAGYVALRSGDRDAFLPADLVARRAVEALGADPDRWRPYRAHALHHLWRQGTSAVSVSRPG